MNRINVLSMIGASVFGAVLTCMPLLNARVVAYDNNIPTEMNAGGSSGDPAQYILGEAYAAALYFAETDSYIGSNTSYNEMIVRNGSEFRIRFGGLSIGRAISASNNSLTVSGMNSEVSIMGDTYVGGSGSNNSLSVQSQTYVSTSSIYIGNDVGSNGNEVIVTGVGSKLYSSSNLVVGQFGSGNRMTVSDGGYVRSSQLGIGNNSSAHNNFLSVSGAGSVLETGSVMIGGDSTNNTLTVEDGALLNVSGGVFDVYRDGDNFIGVDGYSYIALKGDRLEDIYAMIESGYIRYKDDVTYEWTSLNPGEEIGDHFSVVYYADAESALAKTGYADMGDYTFVRTGSMIPEPGTCALALGATMAGLVLMRNHRRKMKGNV